MNNLFITGMGRSGTTLLDKLLTNHKKIDVLSQPLPLAFIEAKKRFLKEKGYNKYYVLNDDLINRGYPQKEFNTYLDNYKISTLDIESIFKKMEGYSGQYTNRDYNTNMNSHFFKGYKESLEKILEFYKIDRKASYLGIKEIMCEEFLPYLCENNYKSILIVRDPRDVLASANYSEKEQHLGMKKPALFILRTWRKSAEYIYLLRKNKNFHFLRYEDLVNNPYRELDKITDFLGTERFSKMHFEKGIFDRNGKPWMANTSFDLGENFISKRSEGIYKNILSDEEIRYTEAICSCEMEYLGYQFPENRNKDETIDNFRDRNIQDQVDLKADFSSQKTNVTQEIERIKTIGNILYKHNI